MTLARKGLAVLGSAAATAVMAVTCLAAPAQAAAGNYVALGDSYSSGTGTRTYYDDGTGCQRSPLAYPSLVSASKGLNLNFRACSGAVVADVSAAQLSALDGGTNYVTISVGGNDAGFADVLTECAQPAWMSDCDEAIDDAEVIVDAVLPGRLDALYGQIRSLATQAHVIVVGYPRLFMGEDCNAFTWFDPAEQARLNSMADRLNWMTAGRAGAAGFAFSDPTSAFIGHAVCDDPEWINGLSNPISESYHPNVGGHQGYAGVVSPSIGGSPTVTSRSALSEALALQAESIVEEQRGYADRDRSITPKTFVAPDLHSPEALAAAEAAGVDVNDPASVDEADRRYGEAQRAARNG